MMRATAQRDDAWLRQLFRFGVAGALSAFVYICCYLMIVRLMPPADAALAVPPAFIVALVCSFFLHRGWSFRARGSGRAIARQSVKFLVTQLVQLGANLVLTWVLTAVLREPTWVPLLPAVLIVPFVTFYVQRRWVFIP